MSNISFLVDGEASARTTVLLAHGAGAPMDTPFMTAMTEGLVQQGLRVMRFEFGYMAERRFGGKKRPPPKAELLEAEYREAVSTCGALGPLVIGGKSMGGRVASLIADDLYAAGRVRGLICLGYPFHPVGKPEKLRTAQLETLRCPALICQGTRDPFGRRDEVEGYPLSDAVSVVWFEDGDHDLKPRKTVAGLTQGDHLRHASRIVADWLD